MKVIAFIVYVIIVGLVFVPLYIILNVLFRSNEERIAEINKEIKAALEEARKATSACQEMCRAAAFAEGLESNMQAHFPSSNLKFTIGPCESTLLSKTGRNSMRALEKCCRLSAEGLERTTEAKYWLICSLFESALLACGNCEHQAGQDACPALSFLRKIELT